MLRREFLKQSAVGTAVFAGLEFFGHAMPMTADAIGTGAGIDVEEGLYILDQGKTKNITPEIRPEIINNPRAVFLIKTKVEANRDDRGGFLEARSQLEDTGKKIPSLIFVKGNKKGGSTFILPNFTTVPSNVLSPVCGIITSPDFVGGFSKGLIELGNTNFIAGARGSNASNHRQTGIYDGLDKDNVNLIEAKYQRYSDYNKKELNWKKVPKPVVWKNIPTYRPIGDPDNFFINMPKLKCHNLGLTTLSIKNLQGSVPSGYGHYCDRWDAMEYLANNSYGTNFSRDFVKDYYQNVESAFLKHRAAGFKYFDYENLYPSYEKKGGWDKFKLIKNDVNKIKEFMDGIYAESKIQNTATTGPITGATCIGSLMWDEQWCQRAIDSASTIKPNINIIEGIIGRDGSGFDVGRDELCNVVIVGLSTTEVDSIGSYIMGHNPNELIYTRIAKERGLGECDPEKIKIFWINDNGSIEPIKNLSEIQRYSLGVNLHTWQETNKRLFW